MTLLETLFSCKRGSRSAAHAAKSLRWSIKQLLKYLIKKFKTHPIHQFLCLDPPLSCAE